MSDSNAPGSPTPDPAAPAYSPPAYDPAPPAAGAPLPPYGAAPQQPQYAPPPPAYGAAPQPYGTAPAYGAAPTYSTYSTLPKTNTLAVVSLIAGIVGLFLIPFIGSIVAVITGHMSLSQIKQTGEGGRGLGLTGTILGWVGLGLIVLTIIIFLALIPLLIANATRYGS